MIELKSNLQGLPFVIIIDGKTVVYERRNNKEEIIERSQWFPPVDKKVLANLDPLEYMQWKNARTEEEVYRLIKFDLVKNGCKNITEKRT